MPSSPTIAATSTWRRRWCCSPAGRASTSPLPRWTSRCGTRRKSAGIQTALEVFTLSDPNRVWTVRGEHIAIDGRGQVFLGSTGQVADQVKRWVDEAGVDGLNLTHAISPGGYEDFGELVVPELQRRGRFKRRYADGTLREKLANGRARLPE